MKKWIVAASVVLAMACASQASLINFSGTFVDGNTSFTYDGKERNLLHEVDILTGVSGGSFPAAYYALHRDAMFQTFREDFLNEDLNDEIAGI